MCKNLSFLIPTCALKARTLHGFTEVVSCLSPPWIRQPFQKYCSASVQHHLNFANLKSKTNIRGLHVDDDVSFSDVHSKFFLMMSKNGLDHLLMLTNWAHVKF